MLSLVKKPRQRARPCRGPPLPSWPWQPGAWQELHGERRAEEQLGRRPAAACPAPPAPPAPALRRERQAQPPVRPHQTPNVKKNR